MERIKLDFLHIGEFLGANIGVLIGLAVLAVICAIVCVIIGIKRNCFKEDIVFSAIFGLVFNVLGLLFVIFRKPVWNNLGWIPVVAAWFLLDGNLVASILLLIYAIIWMFAQHELLERIKEIEL